MPPGLPVKIRVNVPPYFGAVTGDDVVVVDVAEVFVVVVVVVVVVPPSHPAMSALNKIRDNTINKTFFIEIPYLSRCASLDTTIIFYQVLDNAYPITEKVEFFNPVFILTLLSFIHVGAWRNFLLTFAMCFPPPFYRLIMYRI